MGFHSQGCEVPDGITNVFPKTTQIYGPGQHRDDGLREGDEALSLQAWRKAAEHCVE